jgi:hypothetical protein
MCVAVCVLWVRSYSVGEGFTKDGPDGLVLLSSEKGRLDLTRMTTEYLGVRPRPKPTIAWHYASQRSDPNEPDDRDGTGLFRKLGFGTQGKTTAFGGWPPTGHFYVESTWIPHWFVGALFAVLPAIFVIHSLWRRSIPLAATST